MRPAGEQRLQLPLRRVEADLLAPVLSSCLPSIARSQDLSPESLVSTVETYESRPLSLLIYSSKRQATRSVTLVPSRTWSTSIPTPPPAKGHGRQESEASDGGASLLGLSLRFCTPEKALENVWHVLDILEDSPAESAGAIASPPQLQDPRLT